MKKAIVVLLSVVLFSLFTFSAVAADTDTPPCCTPPEQTPPPPPPPQVYVPVPPTPLATASCLRNWTASVYEARQTNSNRYRQPLANAYLKIRILSAQMNDGGTISCSGNVVGLNGSNVDMFYDPRTRMTEVYAYIPEPIFSAPNPTYFLQVHFKFFTSPNQNYMFGTMDASFLDYSLQDGNAINKILYHGDADMSDEALG